MDCCLLCLELNKDLLDSIEANSKQWQDLNITKVLDKHFWPLNIIKQPHSWICLMCWQEVNSFHKFYLRIEEAHTNFGKIKLEEANRLLEPKLTIVEEIENISYCLEPEILIDQNELKAVVKIEECSVKIETDKDKFRDDNVNNKDPLTKPFASKRKNLKHSKRKASVDNEEIHEIKKETTDSDSSDNEMVSNLKHSKRKASEDNEEIQEIKKETTDSDSSDNEMVSNDDDDGSNAPDKNLTEYKKRKEGDKFIADHFKQMFCDLCDVPFENFTAMKKHFLLEHSMDKGYLVCCNRKFYQRNNLVDHLKCHFNPDHFKCTQCGKILSDRKNFNCHMLRVHRPEDTAAKHSCDICGKSFIMAYVLKTHKLKHLPKEEKKFPCTECGKFYASSYLLKIHTEVVHLKKQAKVCYICGKTLCNSTEYKAHMNKHEGIQAPVINCDVCGLRLISERSLKLHKESQHPVGGKKDHPCPQCDKVSPTARALQKHVKTMHEKGCDHKCTMCGKAFRRVEALKEHMASHTGTPLYTCPWCPKTFNSNGNMHAHRKSKHPKEYLDQKLQKYF